MPSGDTPAQWILVIVTTVTAGFICWQSYETRRAAKATQVAAQATQKSVELQQATFRQWLVFKDWTTVYDDVSRNRPAIEIRFQIINPTNLPLTLCNTKMRAKRQESWRIHLIELAPNIPCAVSFPGIQLDEHENNAYLAGENIAVVIFGIALYEDCFRQRKEQDFSGMLRFSLKEAHFRLEWFPDNPLRPKGGEETKQNPN